MKYKNYISLERLKFLLLYEPETGNLIWRQRRSGQPSPGSIAGLVCPDGYVKVRVDRHFYQAHRDKKVIHLGMFASEEEAHRAYCGAFEKYHGQFGRAA